MRQRGRGAVATRAAVMTVMLVLAWMGEGGFGHSNHGSTGTGKELQDLFFAPGSHERVVLPLRINVLLLGFQRDGGHGFDLSASEFKESLTESLSAHVPASWESERALNVEYFPQYEVMHLPSAHLARLEQSIATNLHYEGTHVSATGTKERNDPVATFSVDGKKLEVEVESLLAQVQGGSASGSNGAGSSNSGEASASYNVVIINPDKKQILTKLQYVKSEAAAANLQRIVGKASSEKTKAKDEEDMFVYRYHYGASGEAQMFVGRSRMVLLDLTAGPCQYGGSEVGEGTVSELSLPRLHSIHASHDGHEREEDAQEDMAAMVSAKLVAQVVHMVQFLFAPDVRFDRMQYTEKVLVPIIVFRNHRLFNPFRADEHTMPFHIDLDMIQQHLNRMALPKQKVQLVTGIHALHEHEHIAFAVSKAKRSSTGHEMGPEGRYRVVTRRFVDQDVLAHELHDAADMLTSGLIGSRVGDDTQQVAQPAVVGGVSQEESGSGAGAGASGAGMGAASDAQGRVPLTRILPVYVMSLVGSQDDDLMMKDHQQEHATAQFVTVLQTNGSSQRLPFFTEKRQVTRDPRNVNQAIVAGIAKALGGMVPPTARYSTIHKRMVVDYSLGVGAHPFGPFSNETHVSQIMLDNALRNSIVSRINSAFVRVQAALEHVEAFVDDFVRNPFGESIGHKESEQHVGSYLELLYHQPRTLRSPLGQRTVARLHSDLLALEKKFFHVADVLYDFELEEALAYSKGFDTMAHTFAEYVERELANVRLELECCKVEHVRVSNDSWWWVTLMLLVTVFGVVGVGRMLVR